MKSPFAYGAEFQCRLKNIRELYLTQIRTQNQMQIRRANKQRTDKQVLPGQLCLVLYPLKEEDKVKQTSRYTGLYRIQEVKDYKVVLEPQGGRARLNVHIRRVRVIPTFFYEDYIDWVQADKDNLLSDPERNMSELDKYELETLPPFDPFKVTKDGQHNTSHLRDKCP